MSLNILVVLKVYKFIWSVQLGICTPLKNLSNVSKIIIPLHTSSIKCIIKLIKGTPIKECQNSLIFLDLFKKN